MAREIIFMLIGGLGLFFLGMRTMSDSLKKVASERLKNTLDILTKRPIIGLFVGAMVTCLIQSSSATSVMAVGFVNAGLLTLKQSISILLGANIGTTLTAWLISFFALFKITNYALPAIGAGFLLTMFGKTRSAKMWGQFILGFGLLFTGLGFMKDAFQPLKESEVLKNVLVTFGVRPLLGVILGTVITIILQSSSATIALLQIMAFSGLISFSSCIPIILGDNIGTTITANLSAIGTSTASRRAARAHALLNILGVCYMMIFVYTGMYNRLIEFIVPGPVKPGNVMLHIALAHSVFNIINSLFIFLPLINFLEKLTVKLTPERAGHIDMSPQYLEKHLLDTPTLALEQAVNEIVRMIGIAKEALSDAVKGFFENSPSYFDRVRKQEDAVDNLQKEITQYLVELSQRKLERPEAEKLPVLLHSVNDAERIGDHAINILEISERKIDQKLPFSEESIKRLNKIVEAANAMIDNTMDALHNDNISSAKEVLELEKTVNELQIKLKQVQVTKIKEGKYNFLSSIVYNDFVDNIEKIGDHVTNIAQGVLRHLRWDQEISNNNS
jgi:phosphate:Na+ symporter